MYAGSKYSRGLPVLNDKNKESLVFLYCLYFCMCVCEHAEKQRLVCHERKVLSLALKDKFGSAALSREAKCTSGWQKALLSWWAFTFPFPYTILNNNYNKELLKNAT